MSTQTVPLSALPAPAAPPRRRSGQGRLRRAGLVAMTFIVLIALWQVFVSFIYDGVIPLPTPASTWDAFVEMIETGELQEAIVESGQVLLVGSIPAIVLGILIGLFIGGVRPLDTALAPYLYAFYATPFPALIPIFVLVFGLGLWGKGMIVFTLVFTTVVLQTTAGVKTVDDRFLESARAFGSSSLRSLFEVRLPASMAFIVAGIRLAVGRALVGVVIAEFDTALSGLGALIFRHSGRLRLSHAFVPAVALAIIGIVLSILLRRAEMRLERWRQVS